LVLNKGFDIGPFESKQMEASLLACLITKPGFNLTPLKTYESSVSALFKTSLYKKRRPRIRMLVRNSRLQAREKQ